MLTILALAFFANQNPQLATTEEVKVEYVAMRSASVEPIESIGEKAMESRALMTWFDLGQKSHHPNCTPNMDYG